MAHQPANIQHASCNDEAPVPLGLEQALEVLSSVVPHMPIESQISFLAMSRGSTPNPPSCVAPIIHTRPHRLLLTPDIIRSVVQAKTAQHRYESDSEFEVKQTAAERTSKRSGGSRGITKCYEKPRKNQMAEKRASKAVFTSTDAHTIPSGIPWSGGGATMPGNLQGFETTAGSTTISYHWGPKDL